MKKFLLLIMLPMAAQAAPFLVSNPWPPTGAQPTECVYQEGTTAAVSAPVEAVSGGVRCKLDLANITRTAHSYQVWARNVWGESSKVPFVFNASGPVAISGLSVEP